MIERIWKRLTCGRGHHRFQLRPGITLDGSGTSAVVLRHCPRCGTTTIVE